MQKPWLAAQGWIFSGVVSLVLLISVSVPAQENEKDSASVNEPADSLLAAQTSEATGVDLGAGEQLDPDGPNTAESDSFLPNQKPTLSIPRIYTAIEIDGNLDDEAWKNAARATNFSENFPGERTEPPVDTEAWIAYDDENLYIAFVAQDDDPSSIRASLCDRDRIFQDDFVGIMLDTYGSASWAYELFVNPLGVQGDLRWSNGNEDEGFDIIYHTDGKITDTGYQVEMAIPFSSLRFPNKDVQNWRATFWRTHPRESRRQYTWAATDRDEPCWPCQWGTLAGISNVKPGSRLDLLPGVTAGQSRFRSNSDDAFSTIESENVETQLSMNARYAFTNSLIGEGTLNPDFSQIEADVAQIDVNTTFALFFPERRPFFQEGGDILSSYTNVIYTRSINAPLFATRLTGRTNKTGFAYIGARDRESAVLLPFEEFSAFSELGQTWSNIFRVRQNFNNDSHVGALITDRRYDVGGSGSVGGVDGRIRFLSKYAFEFQVLGSHTEEPFLALNTEDLDGETFDNGRYTAKFDGEQFWGHQAYAGVDRSSRHWNFDLSYREFSPTFRADNGFITQNNLRRVNFWTGYSTYPNTSIFDRVRPSISMGRIYNFNGKQKDEWIRPDLYMQLKGQTGTGISYLVSREEFAGVQFDGIRRLNWWVDSNFSDPLKVGFFVGTGTTIYRDPDDPVLGKGTDFELWGSVKPMQQLLFTPLFTYSKLNHPDGSELFAGYIFRLRTQYQFSRPLFFRLIVQYDDFNKGLAVDPLLSYKLNPFSVAFIGSSHAFQDLEGKRGFQMQARQIFMKIQYLFQM